MRYHKLSEAQFHEMYEEFAIFLATQGINKQAWDLIKHEEPNRIENLLCDFSDLVWDKVISKCSYLEFTTPEQIFLFQTNADRVEALIIKIDPTLADLSTVAGFEKILGQLESNQVEILRASKTYQPSRNEFIYDYLKKGAVLSEGQRFNLLQSYFFNSPK